MSFVPQWRHCNRCKEWYHAEAKWIRIYCRECIKIKNEEWNANRARKEREFREKRQKKINLSGLRKMKAAQGVQELWDVIIEYWADLDEIAEAVVGVLYEGSPGQKLDAIKVIAKLAEYTGNLPDDEGDDEEYEASGYSGN